MTRNNVIKFYVVIKKNEKKNIFDTMKIVMTRLCIEQLQSMYVTLSTMQFSEYTIHISVRVCARALVCINIVAFQHVRPFIIWNLS